MEPLRTGDLVMLRSGGPTMTIHKEPGKHGTMLGVTWFVDGVRQLSDFPPAALLRVPERLDALIGKYVAQKKVFWDAGAPIRDGNPTEQAGQRMNEARAAMVKTGQQILDILAGEPR